MFETYDEAAELNSTCSFCGKDKFKITATEGKYDLERCATEDCEDHCKFGHKNAELQFSLGDRDTVAIVSGWV